MANDPTKTGRQEGDAPLAETGNASNATPGSLEPMSDNQLLSEEAETYLREGGNIEDLPDPRKEQEMDEALNADQ